MIVVLEASCSDARVAEILAELERMGLEGRVLRGGDRPLVHVTGGDTRRARALRKLDEVEGLVPTSGPRVRRLGRRFYPYHFIRWSAAGVFLLGLLVFLAGQLPPGIGAPVDAQAPPEQVVFPWYVAPIERFVGLFPASLAWLGWTVFWGIAAAVLFLPLLDRTRGRSLAARWPVLALGLGLAAAVVALSLGGIGA